MTRLCTTVQGLFGLEQSQEEAGQWEALCTRKVPSREADAFAWRRLACLLHFSCAADPCLLKAVKRETGNRPSRPPHREQGWAEATPHTLTRVQLSRGPKARRKMTHGRRTA